MIILAQDPANKRLSVSGGYLNEAVTGVECGTWTDNSSSYLVSRAPTSEAVQCRPGICSFLFYAMACETTILGNEALHVFHLRRTQCHGRRRGRRRCCRLCYPN